VLYFIDASAVVSFIVLALGEVVVVAAWFVAWAVGVVAACEGDSVSGVWPIVHSFSHIVPLHGEERYHLLAVLILFLILMYPRFCASHTCAALIAPSVRLHLRPHTGHGMRPWLKPM
jgi:hypothetical protein